MRVISNNVGLVKIITIIIIIINFFRLFRFILLLIDLTNLTLIHRKMLLIVLILHFLMIIAPQYNCHRYPKQSSLWREPKDGDEILVMFGNEYFPGISSVSFEI